MRDSPRNGFAIIIAATLRVLGVSSIGRRSVAISSLRNAEASASGSCVSIAPSSSASNSRVRDSDNWISIDAIGASRLIARRPIIPTPPLSRRFPPPKNSSACATVVITPPMAAATDVVRMSRLYTCMSSCPSTPRSSRSFRIARMPSVQHTAALFGLRPVANAFGVNVGATQIVGIGCWARAANSRTIA